MNPKIELKLKLVEMLAKGTLGGLNDNCMPLVKEAYDFVSDGIDFDNDNAASSSMNLSEKTAQELNERLVGLADLMKAEKDLISRLTSNDNAFALDDLHEISLKDGVYLGYDDGHVEMFNGHNDNPDNVEFVAFKFGQVSLKVWGKDIRNVKMTTLNDDDPAMPYVTEYADAAHDFLSGEKRTKDLIARGLNCECGGFKRGWCIPAIGELYVMYLMKDEINKALEYTGREIIRDVWYWSSTEHSATGAWGLRFGNGYFGNYNKSRESSVRPVSAFRP